MSESSYGPSESTEFRTVDLAAPVVEKLAAGVAVQNQLPTAVTVEEGVNVADTQWGGFQADDGKVLEGKPSIIQSKGAGHFIFESTKVEDLPDPKAADYVGYSQRIVKSDDKFTAQTSPDGSGLIAERMGKDGTMKQKRLLGNMAMRTARAVADRVSEPQ